ncbi:4-azaleucine resistance probable transporter AzlC [Butyrivibrio sp. INlla18]|uniref:AzlC family ABC transporter permease n=1 Tax=Butyrivibrio sp. INlla18 TaxID=1520806 RepID=UPI000881A333|nr:AzlC family ABC transporter permease [Butyrivibrio sp. INlla18]SDA63243.1 4-azaleucine resistance probable transporter AzlC [Butyrivibrio sp. INlla18]
MAGRAETVTKAFYKSVPVMAGYIVLGIGFGILLRDAGYGVVWALIMSLFIYAGSMQYVGVGLLTGLICTMLCLALLGPEKFLIPAMLLITFVLTFMRKKEESNR